MTLFQTARLTVRPFRVEDANALFSILSDRSVMEYIEPPFSYEQTVDFLKQAGMCDPPLVYAVIRKADNILLGHLIWHPYEDDGSYELGWVLGRDFWGQGYASELTEGGLALARRESIPALVIECHREQSATRHLAERHGFNPAEQAGNLLRFCTPLIL